MKLRAIYLVFLSLILWAGWARAASLGQEPVPADSARSVQQQTQPPSDSHGEPSPAQASPPAPPGPPQEGPPASPENPPRQGSTQTRPSGQPVSPPPKPPVLRHRKPKAAAKSGQPKRHYGADQSGGSSNKVVVRNGGAQENPGQIEPGVTTATAEQQRVSTTQLLAATDANLKHVEARQLTKAEQSTIEEIRAYMRQAKMASDLGDTSRAQTLAYKARLLSDELAGK